MRGVMAGTVCSLGKLGLLSGDLAERASGKAIDPDAALVARSRAGDLLAFKCLVEKYERRVLSIAVGIVGQGGDAEDIAQETFIKAFRSLKSFKGDSSFYTWLYRIAHNLGIDYSRKRIRRSECSYEDSGIEQNVSRMAVGDYSSVPGVAQDYSPEERMGHKTLGSAIKTAMDDLSPSHKSVIVLREVEGLSYEEISSVVGCSKGTVMSRLFHARRRLQDALKDYTTHQR